MCKRALTGLILGINLLFYAVICRQGDDFHRAEACTNKEGAVNYLSGNRIVLSAENSDSDDASDGTGQKDTGRSMVMAIILMIRAVP